MKLTPGGNKEKGEGSEEEEEEEGDIGIVAHPLAFVEEAAAPSDDPSDKMREFFAPLLACIAGREYFLSSLTATNLSQIDGSLKKSKEKLKNISALKSG